jgi:copper chaperone CopZ
MTHTYTLTGMTCGGCEATVKKSLLAVPNITAVEASKDTHTATVTMEKHIALADLQQALGGNGSKYHIAAITHNETVEQTNHIAATAHDENAEQTKSWVETYKPILLIFTYITAVTLLAQVGNARFDIMQAMRHFMAGFFLVFSFFKLLNLQAFAESYAMYDVVARRLPVWGYIYAFTELGLGLAYVLNFQPVITAVVTLVVMSVSIIGVLQSVLNKRKIQCACLGAVFNLPMSTVTIIEDALMIAMSVGMLVLMR